MFYVTVGILSCLLISIDTGLPLRTTLREDIYVIPYYGVQVIDSTVAFFIFILMATIINFPGKKFKVLLNPLLMNIGGLSLSMYIFQFFIYINRYVFGSRRIAQIFTRCTGGCIRLLSFYLGLFICCIYQ